MGCNIQPETTHTNLETHFDSLQDNFSNGGCFASAWRSMNNGNIMLAECKLNSFLLGIVKSPVVILQF